MDVQVRLAAGLAQQVGATRFSMTLPDGASIADVLSRLSARHPEAASLLATAIPVLGGQLAPPATRLCAGQELALLLPVAGGSPRFNRTHFRQEGAPHDR